MPKILITGGARSGKSSFAQELALHLGGPVLFLATAEPLDAEMAERISAHKKSRLLTWLTLEASHRVGSKIRQSTESVRVVIIDCITLLINNVFNEHGNLPESLDASSLEKECLEEISEIIAAMRRCDASFIIVTNEVGEGLVPVSRVGRLYRDILGKANQMLARECDEVYLMVSGLPLRVKPSER